MVVFGAVAAVTVKVISPGELKVNVPAWASGIVNLRVVTAAGTSLITRNDSYTVAPTVVATAPVVSSVSSQVGSPSGGTQVTVGFTKVTKVAFGAVAGTSVSVVAATELKVTAPAQPQATVNVRVTTAAGTSAITAKDQYTYENALTMTAVSPRGHRRGGNTVTVTGTGFLVVKGVIFGGTAGAAVTVDSPTQLTVTSPAHATGTVDVRVTNLAGTSTATAADQYTYTVPPVTGVSRRRHCLRRVAAGHSTD
jgi:hypothetical protein